MSERVRIEATTAPRGIAIRDTVDGATSRLLTADDPTITPTDRDLIAPVDTTVRLDGVDSLRIPFWVDVFARTPDGTIVDSWDDSATVRVPDAGALEIGGLDVKTYLAVDSGGLVAHDRDDHVLVEPGDGQLVVGARSMHSSPAATITVSDSLDDLATAVSHLSASLKTLSPERSFPTLRGHPPRLERGDDLHVPDDLPRPDSGITITVPRERMAIAAITPLAFYTGAEVQFGQEATLTAGDDSFALDHGSIHETATDFLQRLLTLDCIVRTEGLYQVDLAERARIETDLPWEPAALYDADLETRTQRYLAVDRETVAPAIPRWQQTMDIEPTADTVPALPYAAHNLAAVRPAPAGVAADGGTDTLARGAAAPEQYLTLEPTDAVDHLYVGERIPTSGTKIRPEDFAPDHTPQADPLEVSVVVNDERMREEASVSEIYESRDWYTIETTVREHVLTDELREIIASDRTLLHYIGHIDEDGFECPDGHLHVDDAMRVGIDVAVLNACQSMDQAYRLVRNGAVSALGSLDRVHSGAATEYGLSVARCLSRGYSVNQTQYILQEGTIIANGYIVLGDGRQSIISNEGAFPHISRISQNTSDSYELTYEVLSQHTPGALSTHVLSKDTRYIDQGSTGTWHLPLDNLLDAISHDLHPVLIDKSLHWSYDVTAEQIRRSV